MSAVVDFETIPQLFHRLVERYEGQQRTMLRYKDRTSKEWVDLSYEEVRRRVHALAAYLHAEGVRPGDRVAVLSENRPEWAVTDLATQVLGAVNVSLYTSLPADQVAFILQDSGSKVLVVSATIQQRKAEAVFDDCPALDRVVTMSEVDDETPDYVHHWDDALEQGARHWQEHESQLAPLAEAVRPDDLCALIYTSGTTGRPKGVMLTHDNFCSNVQACLGQVDFGEEDHHLSFLPLCHSFERTAGYNAVLACGARVTYAESIEAVSKNLMEVSPTVMISVPRLFEKVYNVIARSVEEGSPFKKRIFDWSVGAGQRAARAEADGGAGPLLRAQQGLAHRLVFSKLHEKLGGNLRFAVSGGAALPKKIGEFFQAAGITIIEGYGLTETAPVLSINPLRRPRFGTVGHVIPGVCVGIQRLEDGRIVGQLRGEDYPSDLTTEEGEIVVRGPNVMRGYWNDEAATAEVIDADGWYHTGDVGRFEDGYLTITDRIKHMLVSQGGKNIYPGPIEDEFRTVAGVEQILIVGEGQPYLTALVVPDMELLHRQAAEAGLAVDDDEALLAHDVVRRPFEQAFRRYSRTAASHEKVRDFRLLAEPFTVENGLMTPTMKPRRRHIEERYAALIDEMYAQFAQ